MTFLSIFHEPPLIYQIILYFIEKLHQEDVTLIEEVTGDHTFNFGRDSLVFVSFYFLRALRSSRHFRKMV